MHSSFTLLEALVVVAPVAITEIAIGLFLIHVLFNEKRYGK